MIDGSNVPNFDCWDALPRELLEAAAILSANTNVDMPGIVMGCVPMELYKEVILTVASLLRGTHQQGADVAGITTEVNGKPQKFHLVADPDGSGIAFYSEGMDKFDGDVDFVPLEDVVHSVLVHVVSAHADEVAS
ncbi:hypothetical protein CH252_04950 [Rhodococcus sp. 06-1477-1B]|nr:hypothetical protein CH252_04950 [Rhodococcus sp. 06-1477-1B]